MCQQIRENSDFLLSELVVGSREPDTSCSSDLTPKSDFFKGKQFGWLHCIFFCLNVFLILKGKLIWSRSKPTAILYNKFTGFGARFAE